jgi:TRAP-type mannitol/chloroaromatic compound transport system substrate-binding protein
MSWKAIQRNSQGLHRAQDQGQGQLLQDAGRHPAAQLAAWDKVIAKAGENPLFKKVLDSQKAFAERAGQWQNDYMSTSRWPGTTTSAARRPDQAARP